MSIKYFDLTGVTFSVLLFSVVPLIPPLNRVDIPRLTVPDGFQTTSNRAWLVPELATVDVGVIFSALLPALVPVSYTHLTLPTILLV